MLPFGRNRWAVEKTPVGLSRFRLLTIRYEQLEDIYLAFTTLKCALYLPQPMQPILLGALKVRCSRRRFRLCRLSGRRAHGQVADSQYGQCGTNF